MIASKNSSYLHSDPIKDVRLGLVAKDWTFDKFDSQEYARIRQISRQTGRFGILSAFLSARRRHLAQLQAQIPKQPLTQQHRTFSPTNLNKLQQLPSPKIESTSIGSQHLNSKPYLIEKQQEFQEPCINLKVQDLTCDYKQELKQPSTNQKSNEDQKESQKAKGQRNNIKRWKLEKAKVKKIFTTYLPNHEDIKMQTEVTQNPNQIVKSSIATLYGVNYFAELNKKIYVQSPGEDPFFLEVYKYVHHLVKVDLLYPPQEVNLSKIRTFVVRKILDDYVSQKAQGLTEMEKAQFGQLKRRMTKKDKENYQKVGIQIPKSRIENSYLIEIFKKRDFGLYYKQYLVSLRLSTFLKENNKQEIYKLQSNINRIHSLQLSLDDKIKMFKKISKRPVVMGNISQYQSEAKLVLLEYFHE